MSQGDSDWLPRIYELPPSGQLDEEFLAKVFECFQTDFLYKTVRWPNKRFAIKKVPVREGWPATFWHLITEGERENERKLVPERCQKIGWPKAIIDRYLECPNQSNTAVKFWFNNRKNKSRLLISTVAFDYLVVIEERTDYVLLWTAYPARPHTARKLKREHDLYWS